MKIIPFDQLFIPEYRLRREFDEKKLTDLFNSIRSKGLMHPLVVAEQADGTFKLIAGERRSRAIRMASQLSLSIFTNQQEIPPNHFPVTLLSELSPIDQLEAELEENTIRDDLTWQEQATAIACLAELRKQQGALLGQKVTARAVASELSGHEAQGAEISKVTNAIVVAKHLSDPDVMKAKSQKEALKIIERKATIEHRAELAKTFDMKKSSHVALFGCSFEWVKDLHDKSFDVILTDPPYGINADGFGSMASTKHDYQDSEQYGLACYNLVAVEGFRVCKDKAHAYVFLDPRFFNQISLMFIAAGWTVWETPLIWNKLNGMLPKPEFGPRRTYEMILFASKGNKAVAKVMPDVLTYSIVSEKDHGAQKPVPLYVDLLSRSVIPGDQVLDMFSGSGTIFPAANIAKVQATGIEISQEAFNLGVTRLEETPLNLPPLPGL